MNRERIKHITNNHYRKLEKHLKQVLENFEVDGIHQFRVAYKKLRAYLRMISQEKEVEGEIKFSKKLKKAYHISGAIRDLQLQRRLIMEATKQGIEKPPAYLGMLQKEIGKLKPDLYETALKKPVAESKRKTDASIPDKFTLSGFKNFVRQKWAAVYAIIASGHFSDDNIHSIRKSLKDLFYNLNTYGGVEQEMLSISIWKEKDEPYFNKLLDEMGSYQDKCMAIALLKSYRLNSLNTYNRERMERIKKIWIKEKVGIKRLLVRQLKTGFALKQPALE